MVRVYQLTDPDLPENLKPLKEIFMAKAVAAPAEEKPREPGEGLHEYLTRKGIKCFCPICRNEEKNVKKA